MFKRYDKGNSFWKVVKGQGDKFYNYVIILKVFSQGMLMQNKIAISFGLNLLVL